MIAPPFLRRGMMALLGFEISLAIAYYSAICQWQQSPHWLDFNGLRSLPSLMQATHLFLMGGLCVLLLRFRHRMQRPLSVFLPLAVAGLCFYGALDELTKIHLYLKAYNWKAIYIGLLVAIPAVGWRDLRYISRHHLGSMCWIGAGLGIFLLGGFGAEMLKGAIATELMPYASSQLPFLAEHLRITVEEFAELCGETLILYGFAQFTYAALVSRRQAPLPPPPAHP